MDNSQNDTPQNDTPQNDTPQNDTPQNDTPQNDAPQDETLNNNAHQNNNQKPELTKKQKIAGVVCALIAIIFLVNVCSNDEYDPKYKSDSIREEIEYHTKYCEMNNKSACFNLAVKYEDELSNLEAAADFYQKSCDLGNVAGCYNLGLSYANGKGREKSEDKFVEYTNKVCEESNLARACWTLGDYYERFGNDLKAFYYYKEACDLEDTTDRITTIISHSFSYLACIKIANYYNDGKVVSKDQYKVHDYTRKANRLEAQEIKENDRNRKLK